MDTESRALLRDSVLFHELPDDELDEIAASAARRAYARQQLIFAQGDPVESLFLLLQGYVRLYQLPDDNEFTFALLRPGEFFGLTDLSADAVRTHFAQGLTAVSCLSIPLAAVLAHFGRQSALALCLLTHLSSIIGRTEDLAAAVAFQPVRVRLAQVLLRLQEQEHRDGQLPVRLTHADLAAMIATSREQVSQVLTEFEASGYVIKHHGHVVAVHDPIGLRTLVAAPRPGPPTPPPAQNA